METKFTPAPWFVTEVEPCICAWTFDFEKMNKEGFLTREEFTANANLIAAVPELYDELQEVSNWMNSQLGMGDWHKDIEKLLAKARGES